MVAGSYSAGLRGAALADLNRQGFYNAVDDLQERQRQLAMQQSEAASAGLMVPFQDVSGPLTPQIDFGQPVRPIAGGAGGVAGPMQGPPDAGLRTVPIPQPKPPRTGGAPFKGRDVWVPGTADMMDETSDPNSYGQWQQWGVNRPAMGDKAPPFQSQTAQVLVPTGNRAKAEAIFNQLIQVESGGNPNAVSPVGAQGLAQLMPATQADPGYGLKNIYQLAQEMGRPPNDPAVNVEFGKRYLTAMLDEFNGDMQAALIAYNGGPARAKKWLAAGRDDSVIPQESADYYKKVGGQPVKNAPDWAKDLRPAGELSMEYQNVRMMQQALRDQAQTNANLYRTRLARTEQMIETARNVGDITRLRSLMQERDNMMQELAGVRTKLLSDSAELAARESQLAVDGALTQLSFGNIGPVEQVFSQLVGVDVRMELRADGKVNMYYNRAGKPYRLVMDQDKLAENLKQAAFSGERKAAAEAASSAASAAMENELDIRKEVIKAITEAKGDIAQERVKAALKRNGLGTPVTTADGQLFIPPTQAGGTGYIVQMGEEQANGIVTAPRLTPVQGGVGSRVGLNVGAN